MNDMILFDKDGNRRELTMTNSNGDIQRPVEKVMNISYDEFQIYKEIYDGFIGLGLGIDELYKLKNGAEFLIEEERCYGVGYREHGGYSNHLSIKTYVLSKDEAIGKVQEQLKKAISGFEQLYDPLKEERQNIRKREQGLKERERDLENDKNYIENMGFFEYRKWKKERTR